MEGDVATKYAKIKKEFTDKKIDARITLLFDYSTSSDRYWTYLNKKFPWEEYVPASVIYKGSVIVDNEGGANSDYTKVPNKVKKALGETVFCKE